MNDDLAHKVSEWLTKTGYPLEMRVAQLARKAGPMWVDQSRNYYDASSGKVRETDVVVAWGQRQARGGSVVVLTIECKSKPAPWVVFDDGQPPTMDASWHLDDAAQRTATDELGNFRRISLRHGARTSDTLLKPSYVGLSAVEVTFERPVDRNGAWDAIRAAVSAAHGVLAEFDAQQIQTTGGNIVAFPVVVTTGRLFRSYLEDGEMRLQEADRLEVRVRMGERLDQTRCLIVTEEALPQLLADAAKTPAALTIG